MYSVHNNIMQHTYIHTYIHTRTHAHTHTHSKVALRLLVIVFLIITRFTYTVLNAVVAFLVNNSVTADKLGSVNGTAMVAGAVFRYIQT